MRNFLFSHLWDFVSKFTEYDAKKLYKLYKHAVKKAKPEKDVEEKVSYLLTMIPKYNIYLSCASKYHLNLTNSYYLPTQSAHSLRPLYLWDFFQCVQ